MHVGIEVGLDNATYDIHIGSQPKIEKGETLWHSTDYVNQNEFQSVEKDVYNNPAKNIKFREDLI